MTSVESSYQPNVNDCTKNVNDCTKTVLEIDDIERWNVFNRLRDLSIPCECSCGKPLQVEVTTASSAIQLWSVVQLYTASRSVTIDYLERCWKARSRR